jgi:hypothetical protein
MSKLPRAVTVEVDEPERSLADIIRRPPEPPIYNQKARGPSYEAVDKLRSLAKQLGYTLQLPLLPSCPTCGSVWKEET